MRSNTAFLVLLGHSVIIQIIVFSVRPTLSYTTLESGASPAMLGIVAATYALPALALAIPAGRIVDRLGERPSLLIGSVAVAIAVVIGLLSLSALPLLIVSSVVLGTGQVLTVIGQQAFVGNVASAGRSDSLFGYYGFAASAGQAIGPLLLALPGGSTVVPPLELIMLISLVLSVLMLGLSAAVRSTRRLPNSDFPPLWSSSQKIMAVPGLTRALVASALVIASVDMFVAYAPLIGIDRGHSAFIISAVLVVRSLFSMLSRLFLGRMTKLFGRRRLLVTSILITSASMFVFAFPLSAPGLVIAGAIYGFFVGMCQPITMSWISIIAPEGTRGLTMSFRLATNRLGQTTVPAAVGTMSVSWGPVGVFGASGALLLLAAWLSKVIPNSEDD